MTILLLIMFLFQKKKTIFNIYNYYVLYLTLFLLIYKSKAHI